jgi:hypothetical protein
MPLERATARMTSQRTAKSDGVMLDADIVETLLAWEGTPALEICYKPVRGRITTFLVPSLADIEGDELRLTLEWHRLAD